MAKKTFKSKAKQIPEVREPIGQEPLFPLKGYLILNVIFWGYCLVQLVVLRWLFRDVVGLIFFFVVLGAGFTLVSVYDYAYDRLTHRNKDNSLKHEAGGTRG